MNNYSPLMFKNPDKRTNLPDVVGEEFTKEQVVIDKDAAQRLKEILENVQR